MSLSMQQIPQMQLATKLDMEMLLKLGMEMKQEMVQMAMDLIPEDLGEFITFENDEDIDLLVESFPFLMLHEANHPLYSRGMIYVPPLSNDVEAAVKFDQRLFGRLNAQAAEIGVDSGAFLVGQHVCSYSMDELARSHAAITERVVRDMLEREKFEPEYCLLARLDAALRLHHDEVGDDDLQRRIRKMNGQVAEAVEMDLEGSEDLYHLIVNEYMRIYRGTAMMEARAADTKKDVEEFAGQRKEGYAKLVEKKVS